MGWASGSTIVDALITSLRENVKSDDVRKNIYLDVITAFEDADWDTQDECEGYDPAFDEALKELHPDWDRQDDDEDEE